MASFLYLPTVAGNGIYAGIFGIYVALQLYLGIKHKTWGYMVAMILGLVSSQRLFCKQKTDIALGP